MCKHYLFMDSLIDLQRSCVLYKVIRILCQFPSDEVKLTVFCNLIRDRMGRSDLVSVYCL